MTSGDTVAGEGIVAGCRLPRDSPGRTIGTTLEGGNANGVRATRSDFIPN